MRVYLLKYYPCSPNLIKCWKKPFKGAKLPKSLAISRYATAHGIIMQEWNDQKDKSITNRFHEDLEDSWLENKNKNEMKRIREKQNGGYIYS